MKPTAYALSLACAAVLAGCGDPTGITRSEKPDEPCPTLALGTSLTSGYTLGPTQSWTGVANTRLRTLGVSWTVQNGAESGALAADVFAQGRRLLAEARPRVVVIEMGGNEMLRAQGPAPVRLWLDSLLTIARATPSIERIVVLAVHPGAISQVPIVGPQALRVWETVVELGQARADGVVEHMLEGVLGRPSMTLLDLVHPNAAGHERAYQTIAPVLHSAWRSLSCDVPPA